MSDSFLYFINSNSCNTQKGEIEKRHSKKEIRRKKERMSVFVIRIISIYDDVMAAMFA